MDYSSTFPIGIDKYRRYLNEDDDSPRIRRAVSDNPVGILMFPKGIYFIGSPIYINNNCSF